MWAVGAQVHFSWLPRLHFFPLFESSPHRLRTHHICNRFCIVMLDSYRWRCPAHPFCVVALVSYRPFWIVAVSPVSCRHTRRHLTHFGLSPSHPFWIVTISPVLDRRCLTHFGSSLSHPFWIIAVSPVWIATVSPVSCRHVSPILDCHPSLANEMGYAEALVRRISNVLSARRDGHIEEAKQTCKPPSMMWWGQQGWQTCPPCRALGHMLWVIMCHL